MTLQTFNALSSANWTERYRREFIANLEKQGYTRGSVRTYNQVISLYCSDLENHAPDVKELTGSTCEDIRKSVLADVPEGRHTYTKFCLGRFIEHLAGSGLITLPVSPAKERTPLDLMCEEYGAYLRHQRGLSETSIYENTRYMVRFMTFRFGETLGNLDDITPANIVAFIGQLRARSRPCRDKALSANLRNLFRFLFWSGKTKRDLACSLPRVAAVRTPQLSRAVKPEEVERLIEAVRGANPIARRNYAMLLVMARLGLRAPEVIAIRLDDIDWRGGTILIRGKGKRQDRMPLPEDVGKAIVDYIRNGRPGNERTLFVSHKVPFPPFVDAQILNTILRSALKKTGIRPPQAFLGSHLLRHSLATNMLRKGASLDEIGDVLRHRSRTSTIIYARHDIEGLRSIAGTWPVKGDPA